LLYFINKILHLSKKRQSENSALALIRSSDHEASKMANWYHVLLNLFWTDTGGKQGVALVVGGLRATFCRLRETAGDLWERVNQDSRNTSRPQNKAGMGIRMVEWYVYYSPIGDGSLYTGITKDVESRVSLHDAWRGAKYTRDRRPVELVYCETVGDRGAAGI